MYFLVILPLISFFENGIILGFNLKVVYVYENLINIVIIIKKRIWNLLKK